MQLGNRSEKRTNSRANVPFEHFADGWIERSIFERFEYVAKRYGNRIAVDDGLRQLTYRELMRACMHLASRIDAQVLPEGPVGVMLPNCALVPIAALACLAVGRPFVPLDINYPATRNEQILAEAGVKALLVDYASIETTQLDLRIPQIEISITFDTEAKFTKKSCAASPAVITYTSGSTGRPKGVCVNQQSISFNVADFTNSCHLNSDDCIILLSSASLLISYWSIFGALLNGGTLFVADPRRLGVNGVLRRFREGRITVCLIVPTLFRALINLTDIRSALGDLRVIQLGGEPVYARDIDIARKVLSTACEIQIGYGSTEAAGLICKWFVPPGWAADGPRVPCGYPLSGHIVRVAEEEGASLHSGELVVKSRYVALGLWQSGRLQQGPFEQDPIDPSLRILHTGDLAHLREDGLVEIVGRKDRQVKVRGLQANPSEIEDVLRRCKDVADAVVVAREDEDITVLVAYVVPIHPAVGCILTDLKATIARELPGNLRPSRIHLMSNIPLLPNFKPDIIALDALVPPFREEARMVSFRDSSNDREHELCAIWQKALKLPKISIDDDFFELGGTSLQALMVFAEIEARLGCSLSPAILVQASTIARLAELIQATKGTDASKSLVPLRTSGKGLPLFLVSGRTWVAMFYRHLVSDLDRDRPVYGLQPPPLDGKHRIARTVEAMAAEYIAEIKRVQPQGPYHVAGHSFGGWVSFEIAQQLTATGERVDFLGLIDSVPLKSPVVSSPLVSEAVHLGHRVRHTTGFRDLLFQGQRYVRNAVLDLWFRQGYSIPHKYRPEYFAWVCTRVSRNYVPKPYADHVTMFSAMGASKALRDYWTPLARGGLTVLEVPGGHVDMVLPPHSKSLAEHFDTCLNVTPAPSRSSVPASVL